MLGQKIENGQQARQGLQGPGAELQLDVPKVSQYPTSTAI